MTATSPQREGRPARSGEDRAGCLAWEVCRRFITVGSKAVGLNAVDRGSRVQPHFARGSSTSGTKASGLFPPPSGPENLSTPSASPVRTPFRGRISSRGGSGVLAFSSLIKFGGRFFSCFKGTLQRVEVSDRNPCSDPDREIKRGQSACLKALDSSATPVRNARRSHFPRGFFGGGPPVARPCSRSKAATVRAGAASRHASSRRSRRSSRSTVASRTRIQG